MTIGWAILTADIVSVGLSNADVTSAVVNVDARLIDRAAVCTVKTLVLVNTSVAILHVGISAAMAQVIAIV
jgi:hypothetical protein